MNITAVEFKNKKPNLRYDSKRKRWIGYRVDVRVNTKRHRPVFRTKDEAERFVTELRTRSVYRNAGLRLRSRSDVSVRDLFDKRLPQVTVRKSFALAERVFNEFVAMFDYPPKVTEVRTAHLQLYINKRLATGIRPETVDREITALSTALKRAAAFFPEELEDYEPPKIVRPTYKKRKKKKRVITETEKDGVIHSILTQRLKSEQEIRTRNRPVVAWIFEIGWMLGLRLSEVLGLLKTDAKRAEGTLRVRRWKTGDVSVLPYLPDRVFDILDEAAAASATKYIFDMTCSEHTFAKIVRDACVANGIVYGQSATDGVTFHSTRHSFTSRLTKVTDIATAGEYTSHSSGEMVDYYSQADEESKRLAMQRMYGGKNTELLEEIFEKVRSGNMDLTDFLAAVK